MIIAGLFEFEGNLSQTTARLEMFSPAAFRVARQWPIPGVRRSIRIEPGAGRATLLAALGPGGSHRRKMDSAAKFMVDKATGPRTGLGEHSRRELLLRCASGQALTKAAHFAANSPMEEP